MGVVGFTSIAGLAEVSFVVREEAVFELIGKSLMILSRLGL